MFKIVATLVVTCCAVSTQHVIGAGKLRRMRKEMLPRASWGAEAEYVFNKKTDSSSQNRNDVVHVVLCTSAENDPRLLLFSDRLHANNYQVVHIDCSDVFEGPRKWGLRLLHYKQVAENLPDDAVIAFLDSYDMVVQGSAEEAAKRFRSFSVPLVASCTVATWPSVEKCPAYENISSPYVQRAPKRKNMYRELDQCSLPCAGAMMGYKSAFLDLFASSGFDADTDDQCWLHSALSKRAAEEAWKLDYNSRLFLEWQSVDKRNVLSDSSSRVHIVDSDGLMEPFPTFIHLDGLHPDVTTIRKFYPELNSDSLWNIPNRDSLLRSQNVRFQLAGSLNGKSGVRRTSCDCTPTANDWKPPESRSPKNIYFDLGSRSGDTFPPPPEIASASGFSWQCESDEALLVEANADFKPNLTAKTADCSDVRIFVPKAIAHCDGTTSLYMGKNPHAWGATIRNDKSFDVDYSNSREVDTLNLMRLLHEQTLPDDKVLIKMDIEGAEFDILPCLAQSPIATNIDYLVFERHDRVRKIDGQNMRIFKLDRQKVELLNDAVAKLRSLGVSVDDQWG